MKCIRCGHDSKYRERASMTCPACRGSFAFEPRQGALMTDAAFQAAIDAVSGEGGLRWGVEHLYYEVCRRIWRNRYLSFTKFSALIRRVFTAKILLGAFLLAFFVRAVAGSLFAFFLIGVGAVLWVLIKRWQAPDKVDVPIQNFNQMWSRWTEVHGTPAGVIMRQEKPIRRRPVEPDLGDYSFDRAVICDRARTVDLLLANNFHFENNCAILAIGGYPEGPFETVRAMLRRNPRLQVFALHDATVDGCKMAYRLANDDEWFKGQARVTDVGLRPSQAAPFRGLFLPPRDSLVLPGEGLTQEDARWLSLYSLELAAIRPEQIIKRLFRAINRKSEVQRETRDDREIGDDLDIDGAGASNGNGAGSNGGGGVEQDAGSLGVEAGDSDGGADAFG